MDDLNILPKRKELIDTYIPKQVKEEYYSKIFNNSPFYICVTINDLGEKKLFFEDVKDKESYSYIFWSKANANRFMTLINLQRASEKKSQLELYSNSFYNIIKIFSKANKKKDFSNGFNLIAVTYQKNKLIEVDISWSYNNYML